MGGFLPPLSGRVASLVGELLDEIGAQANRDLLGDILAAALRLAADDADRLDLKITNSAIHEMTEAFRVFSPYRDVPKVTIFGSARTLPADPLYALARDLASTMAQRGWMVVTGAGPGIMAAGLEGAGRERAFGINIRLPFETPNAFIASDPKLVEMKYFFTRKLMLMKESDAYAVLPGGFGTQDEAFELLTLVQTGKAEPAPIVLLDTPSGSYWSAWQSFVDGQLASRGLISQDDEVLYRITDDVTEAVGEILGFYSNYHSRRFVGHVLVLRLRKAPGEAELAELSKKYSDICDQRGIWRTGPLPPERSEKDHLDLERVALRFDRLHHARLRALLDDLNALGGASDEPRPRRSRARRRSPQADAQGGGAVRRPL